MHPPKPLILTALILVLVQTVGCTSFRPLTGALPNGANPSTNSKDPVIRVETLDGTRLKLFSGWSDSAWVGGNSPNPGHRAVAIPLSDVQRIDESYVSWKKTILGLAVVTVGLGFLIGLYRLDPLGDLSMPSGGMTGGGVP